MTGSAKGNARYRERQDTKLCRQRQQEEVRPQGKDNGAGEDTVLTGKDGLGEKATKVRKRGRDEHRRANRQKGRIFSTRRSFTAVIYPYVLSIKRETCRDTAKNARRTEDGKKQRMSKAHPSA